MKVEIDTAVAKELHGDTDHRYEITAEVADESRRTIVGTGQVLVARKPFKVYAWVDRGHYRVGDAIEADFRARTLDDKPRPGQGRAHALQGHLRRRPQAGRDAGRRRWDLDTDAEGEATQQITASETGQYRLSYELTDEPATPSRAATSSSSRGEGFDGSQFRFNDLELVPDKPSTAPARRST